MSDIDMKDIEDIFGELGKGVKAHENTEYKEPEPPTLEVYEWPEWSDHPDIEGCQYRDVSCRHLFNQPTMMDATVRQYQGLDKLTPILIPEKHDPYYPDLRALESLVISSNTGLKAMLYGHTGCGKTSLLEYFAACTGRPFVRVVFDAATDADVLFGSLEMSNGNTYFNKTDLVKSMELPCLCGMDEFSRATSTATMLVNPVLDRGIVTVTSYGDEEQATIIAHPEWMVAGTDNTNGTGDGMDLYNSANVLDEAIRNRFDLYNIVPCPNYDIEREMIEAMSGGQITGQDSASLARFSQSCHKAFEDREVTTAFSARNIKAICKLHSQGMELKPALEANFFNRVAESEVGDVKEMWRAIAWA